MTRYFYTTGVLRVRFHAFATAFAVGLALLPLAAVAQTIDSAEKLTAFIRAEMSAESIPGVQVYASKGGEVVYHEALGLANVDARTPMTKQTLSLLASVSKPVTGAALLTLVDAGEIALDDPINDHLPFDVVHPDYPATDITPRMLLTHRSGIVDGDFDLDVTGDSPISLDTFIRDLLTPDGQYYSADTFGDEPGTSTLYSNDGIALMGYLVEAVSEKSFETYSQEALFGPLNMDRTSWFLSGLAGQPVAQPHVREAGAYRTLPNPGFPDYPAGQLRTSPAQLARFLQMIQNGGTLGGTRVLEQATVTAMLTPSTTGTDSDSDEQGFVWYRETRSGRVSWEHNGSVEGITTLAAMLIDEDVNVIVLTNGEEVAIDAIVEAVTDFALDAATTVFISEESEVTARALAITPPTPNPFSNATRVTVRVGTSQNLRVALYDVLGRSVALLHDGLADGSVAVSVDGASLSPGIYVIHAQGETGSASQSLTRVR